MVSHKKYLCAFKKNNLSKVENLTLVIGIASKERVAS